MILDSLNNTEKIECLHPLFKKAFDYLKSTDFSKMEDGKYELEGSRLYVNVASIFGKEKKDAAIETHKIHRYPDAFVGCRKDRLETGI